MTDSFITTAIEQYNLSREAMLNNHMKAKEDIDFVVGRQWTDAAEKDRRKQKRPMMTFNKLRQFIKHVANEQRQQRPGTKVNPANGDAVAETADFIEGMIRNIENISAAEYIYDYTLDQVLEGGFGYWRIITEFSDDDGFDQDIKIRRIKDRFSVTLDHTANEWSGEDGQYAFVEEVIKKKEFERRWPDSVPSSWNSNLGWSSTTRSKWVSEDEVKIAEYFYKVPTNRHLVMFENGAVETIPEGIKADDYIREYQTQTGVKFARERRFKTHKVKWAKISPFEKLEEADWAGKHIPIIPCYGDITHTGEEDYMSGLVRFMKDGNRLVNYFWTTAAEAVALAPKEPVVMTAKQIEGRESDWNNWHKTTKSVLVYNQDEDAPGKPSRLEAANNAGQVLQMAIMAANELHDLSGGINPATLGKPSNEQSGVAISERKEQGQIATFNYIDNLARAIMYSGIILVDLIPKIYDTQRVVRILGEDGQASLAGVNGAVVGEQEETIDLSLGKYDAVVEVGAGFATRRQEAANTVTQIIQSVPAVAPILLPLLLKNVDVAGADEALEALSQLQQQAGTQPTPPGAPNAGQLPPQGLQ